MVYEVFYSMIVNVINYLGVDGITCYCKGRELRFIKNQHV